MKRYFIYVMIFAAMVCFSGCGVAEFALSDVNGWDYSACVSSFNNFGVCNEFFWDNFDIIQEQGGLTLP